MKDIIIEKLKRIEGRIGFYYKNLFIINIKLQIIYKYNSKLIDNKQVVIYNE